VKARFQRASPVSEVSEIKIDRLTRSEKLKGRSNSSFCQNLSKSQIDRFPLSFVFFVIGVNQLQKHVIILKTQILNGRLIRISNLRRDVRRTFQGAGVPEHDELHNFSLLGGKVGADRIVQMADRRHRGHRLVRGDVDVNGEPEGCGRRTCGRMITQDFGEFRAVSNGGR
jgi:hypothetical protein